MIKQFVPVVLLAAILAGCPKGEEQQSTTASSAPAAAASAAAPASEAAPAASGAASTSDAEDHDLSLKNSTGAQLKAVYYKRSNDDKDPWTVMSGDDPKDVVWEKDEDSKIKLESPKYDHDCDIDIKVVTATDVEWHCGPVTLCDAKGNAVKKKIVLTMEKGELSWEEGKDK